MDAIYDEISKLLTALMEEMRHYKVNDGLKHKLQEIIMKYETAKAEHFEWQQRLANELLKR